MTREPLITIATITAAVTAVLGLLVSFGVSLSGEQQAAILGVAAVVAPLIVAAVARSRVAPWTEVAAIREGGTVVAGPAAVQATGSDVVVTDPKPDAGPWSA